MNGPQMAALTGCIRTIYSDLNPDTLPESILSAISPLIPSGISSFFNITSDENGAIRTKEVQKNRRWDHLDIFNAHIHEHPFVNILNAGRLQPHPYGEEMGKAFLRRIAAFQGSPENMAVKISDVLTDRQLKTLVLYNDFFRLNRVDFQIGLPLACGKDFHTVITFNRDSLDFTEKERSILGFLGPHIKQALRNAEILRATEAHSNSGRGIIILEERERIGFVSPNGERILGSLKGRKGLEAELTDWLKPREHGGVALTGSTYVIEEQQKRVVVSRLGFRNGDAILIVSEEPKTTSPHALEGLGLSSKEAEVLFWIAQGKSNLDISRILGNSPNTVKTHVWRIFEKLGVENRTSAARLALDLLTKDQSL